MPNAVGTEFLPTASFLFRGMLLAGLGTLMACAVIDGAPLSDAQQAMVDLTFGPSDFAVTGHLDHPDGRYRIGEPIGLTVQVSKPASVAVLEVLPNGATTLIFPNRRHPETPLTADTPVAIPGAATRIVAGASGSIILKVIASERSGSWLFTRKPDSDSVFSALGTSSRAIAKDISLSLKGGGTATTVLMVRVEGS
ncbi:MAG: DUF4384 domain-containing protein [Alphaproteobacteria bacterium]|nr:DUF4384 domain-containing protein [Alphaproteobacteria bacterium]